MATKLATNPADFRLFSAGLQPRLRGNRRIVVDGGIIVDMPASIAVPQYLRQTRAEA